LLTFYFLIVIIGLAAAVWLFFSETQQQNKKNSPSLLDRLELNTSKTPTLDDAPALKPVLADPDLELIQEPFMAKSPAVEIKNPESSSLAEIALKETEILELTSKYERLESLFKEKGEELDKKEKALLIEIKTRKDFNKVKDILEKEIKDIKEDSHKLELELGASRAETEGFKKRITQLEEKIKQKEDDIKSKEQKIDELSKLFANAIKKDAINASASHGVKVEIKETVSDAAPAAAPVATPVVEPAAIEESTKEETDKPNDTALDNSAVKQQPQPPQEEAPKNG